MPIHKHLRQRPAAYQFSNSAREPSVYIAKSSEESRASPVFVSDSSSSSSSPVPSPTVASRQLLSRDTLVRNMMESNNHELMSSSSLTQPVASQREQQEIMAALNPLLLLADLAVDTSTTEVLPSAEKRRAPPRSSPRPASAARSPSSKRGRKRKIVPDNDSSASRKKTTRAPRSKKQAPLNDAPPQDSSLSNEATLTMRSGPNKDEISQVSQLAATNNSAPKVAHPADKVAAAKLDRASEEVCDDLTVGSSPIRATDVSELVGKETSNTALAVAPVTEEVTKSTETRLDRTSKTVRVDALTIRSDPTKDEMTQVSGEVVNKETFNNASVVAQPTDEIATVARLDRTREQACDASDKKNGQEKNEPSSKSTSSRKKRKSFTASSPSKTKASGEQESVQSGATEASRYPTGTEVRRFCSEQGHWLSGWIIHAELAQGDTTETASKKSEKAAKSSLQYLIHFENDTEMICPEEEMEKMVALSRIGAGTRLAIYWPADDLYYPATVTQERDSRKAFFIVYDDGEKEWINLWRHKFVVLEEEGPEHRSTRTTADQNTSRESVQQRAPRKGADSVVKHGTLTETPKVASRRGGRPRKTERIASRGESDGEWSNADSEVEDSAVARKTRKRVYKDSDTDGSDENELESTPRRRRGRPKKGTAPKHGHASSGGSKNQNVDEEASGGMKSRSTARAEKVEKDASPPRARNTGRRGTFPEQSSSERVSPAVLKSVTKHAATSKGGRPAAVARKVSVENRADSDTSEGSDHGDTDYSSRDEESVSETEESKKLAEIKIGDRVAVYWPDDRKYYNGTVTKQRNGRKPFYLEYDDGDDEWIDFSQHKYRLLENRKSKSPLSKSAERRRLSPRLSSPAKRRLSSPAKSPSEEVARIKVGTRVDVWWPEDHRYYRGVVTRKQDDANWRPFFIEYDDGDEEWIDFRQHKFRIISGAADEESSGEKEGICTDLSQVWIGARLAVWWPAEKEYFECTVTRYRDHSRSFYLEYDDGDREWIDLEQTKFKILDE